MSYAERVKSRVAEIMKDEKWGSTWPARFYLAVYEDQIGEQFVRVSFDGVMKSRIQHQSGWDERYPGWQHGIHDGYYIMRFVRGGVVKNIYDDENGYPRESRYTFRVALYRNVQWPEGYPYWSMRILTHEECKSLGFNSVTGESDTYSYINVGGNDEYRNIKQSWEDEQRRRRDWAMRKLEELRSASHWKELYKIYLNSAQWRIFRWNVRKYFNFTCQRCGSTSSLDVHHLHYETIGEESIHDVTLLCRTCHESEHNITESAS